MVTELDDVPPALVAWQVNVVPLVSVFTVVDPHPEVEVTADSLSETAHDTLTLLTYQPLFPSVPVTVGVMTGGVVSAMMLSAALLAFRHAVSSGAGGFETFRFDGRCAPTTCRPV